MLSPAGATTRPCGLLKKFDDDADCARCGAVGVVSELCDATSAGGGVDAGGCGVANGCAEPRAERIWIWCANVDDTQTSPRLGSTATKEGRLNGPNATSPKEPPYMPTYANASWECLGTLKLCTIFLPPWRLLPVSGTAATGAAAAAEPPFFPFFVVGFFVLPFVFFSFFALAFLSFLLPVRGVGEVSAGSVSSSKSSSASSSSSPSSSASAPGVCALARCCSRCAALSHSGSDEALCIVCFCPVSKTTASSTSGSPTDRRAQLAASDQPQLYDREERGPNRK